MSAFPSSDNSAKPSEPNPINKEQREKIKELVEVLGVSELRNDLDAANQNIEYLTTQLGEAIKRINQQSDVINGPNNTNPQQQESSNSVATQLTPDKMMQIEQLASIAQVIKNIFSSPKAEPTGISNIISQEFINEKVAKMLTNSFDLGEDIVDSVKRSITGKTTRGIVTKILTQSQPAEEQHGPST